MSVKLPIGKINSHLLKSLLSQIPVIDETLVLPPDIGIDAAALHIDGEYWAVATDPITFSSTTAAKDCIEVNINDIVCAGCEPRYFLSTILLPVGFSDVALQKFWQQLVAGLKHYQLQLVGGHMEVTSAVNSPVVVGQILGKLAAPAFYDMHQAKAGDKILLWNPVAIEGTALLTEACFDKLAETILVDQLETMKSLRDHLGICVLPAAEKLFKLEGVVGLHDPTEGGIATAIHEIADVSRLGVSIVYDNISILSETRQLADALGFDPLGLLASGCLLIVCKPYAAQAIVDAFEGRMISEIGELVEGDERELIVNKKAKPLPRYDQDEITRFLA